MTDLENKMNEEELEQATGGARPGQDAGFGLEWYCIRPGDTLIRLAERFGTTVQILMNLNRDRKGIRSKDLILDGFWIRVPV